MSFDFEGPERILKKKREERRSETPQDSGV